MTIDYKTDSTEALRLQQSIQERDGELGLAGAGRHRQQHRAVGIVCECILDGVDRSLLIVAERKSKFDWQRCKAFLGSLPVDIQFGRQALRRGPVGKGTSKIGRITRITEPDAALRLDLLEVGPSIGGKQERNAKRWLIGRTGVKSPWPAFWKFNPVRRNKTLRVAACLINGGLYILAFALGLYEGDALHPDEQRIVRRAIGSSATPRWPLIFPGRVANPWHIARFRLSASHPRSRNCSSMRTRVSASSRSMASAAASASWRTFCFSAAGLASAATCHPTICSASWFRYAALMRLEDGSNIRGRSDARKSAAACNACHLLGKLAFGGFGLCGQLFPYLSFLGCPFRALLSS